MRDLQSGGRGNNESGPGADLTEAEKLLWRHLGDHGLTGRSVRRRAAIGPYVVDVLIPSLRLIIDLDGGAPAVDPQRDARLARLGYCTLRFWNNDISTNLPAFLKYLADALPAE